MRVCQLSLEYPPYIYGGVGVHVAHLSGALARAGAEVEVRARAGKRPQTVGGVLEPPAAVKVRRYPRPEAQEGPQKVTASLEWGLRLAAEPYRGDIVHGHTWYCAQPVNWLAALSGAKSVMSVHSLEPLRPWKAEQLGPGGCRLSTWMERVGLEQADHLIAVSSGMKADLLASYRIPEEKVTVIPNGVDTTAFHPGEDPETLTALGVEPPYLLFVGRLTRQKGLFELLSAFANLETETGLVLVTGAADTPALEAELAAGVRADSRIIWLNRALGLAELRALYAGAEAFVCPSLYEPFGIINLEAMACGAPVVASRVGGIVEAVDQAGLLVEPGDTAALARTLEDLLADEPHRRRLARAGLARAREFGWDSIATRTLELYRQLVEG